MPKSIRSTHFVPEWIDLTPRVPVPKIDWIQAKQLDVPYGTAPLQKFDLYYPAEPQAAFPTVILVHGGGFMWCDKRDWHLYPGFFALAAGFALVSVNYRLAPFAPFPAAVEDLKSTVCYLRQHASELHLDPDNFFLYGTSAGGNLVSYVGLDGVNTSGAPGDYHVNAVAALCPLINFSTYLNQALWILRLVPDVSRMMTGYLGGMPQKVPQRAKAASADSRIREQAPPFYIQHGDKDINVNVQQAVDFHHALSTRAHLKPDDLVLDILKGTAHAGAGPEFLERTNVEPILAFFKKHCK